MRSFAHRHSLARWLATRALRPSIALLATGMALFLIAAAVGHGTQPVKVSPAAAPPDQSSHATPEPARPSVSETGKGLAAPLPVLAVVRHASVTIDGVKVFYREAGPRDAPALLLLHGFPSSSSMFRAIIPVLGTRYRVIAPDYPGFGQSDAPPRETFEYSFDHLASIVDKFTAQVGLARFALYVQDYGAPIGYRIASAHPDRITGLIIQNGNAYDEGIDNDFWKPIKAYWNDRSPGNRAKLAGFLNLESTRWQYTHGAPDPSLVSPDAWLIDQSGLDRTGNKEIQLDMFLSYSTNPPLYPKWQQYFRSSQPPALIVWGKNDQIFPAAGAEPYKRDLKDIDYNLLDAGHFALEENPGLIAGKIDEFLQNRARK